MSNIGVSHSAVSVRDTICLSHVLSALRAHRLKIMLAAVVGALLGAAFAVGSPKYEAKGFYYTPGWSLADYKRFRSEFGPADALGTYFSASKAPNQAAATLLAGYAGDLRFWDTIVKPLHPLTKRDAKEVFEGGKSQDSLTIMGLEMSLVGKDGTVARDAVHLLGAYITQTLLYTSLRAWLASAQSTGKSELLKAENEVLQTRFSISQTQQRISDLRILQSKYPDAQRMEMRQVINADKNSSRYLAPLAQIVALETAVTEANESLRRMERRAGQLEIETAFFDAARLEAESVSQGWHLLERLEVVKKQIFKSMNLTEDAIREVSNRLDLDLSAYRDQYSIGFGFKSDLLVPLQSKRSPTTLAIRAGLLGLALAALAAVGPTLLRWFSRGMADDDEESDIHFDAASINAVERPPTLTNRLPVSATTPAPRNRHLVDSALSATHS